MQAVQKEVHSAGLERVLGNVSFIGNKFALQNKFADKVKHNLHLLYPVPAGFIRDADDDFTDKPVDMWVNSVDIYILLHNLPLLSQIHPPVFAGLSVPLHIWRTVSKTARVKLYPLYRLHKSA